MTEKEIINIINKGEGISVEFKKAENRLPGNLFETVCAFLNRDGGTILLGVEDEKTVSGVEKDFAEEMCNDFANLSNNPNKLSPVFLLHPKVVEFKEKTLIHVFVPASSQVHKTSGVVFDRSSDGDFRIKTDSLISQLYLRKSSYYSENMIFPYLKEEHFTTGVVDKALQIIRNNRPGHPWLNLSRPEFYKSAGLYRNDIKTGEKGFTLTALLLFGKEEFIQSAIPHYKIDALLRREDTNRYDDRENIRCNLVDAYEVLLNFANKHLPDKFYMQGDQRISLREKIFREIIANLLIHREYTNAHPATFIIYKNRVEIKNANRPHLMGKLTPGNFEPFPKNPNLAKFFVQMARAEDLGTGINNVYKYLNLYTGTTPEFKEEQLFKVIIPLNKKGDGELNGGLNGGLNERQEKVIKYISENPGSKIKDISLILGIPVNTLDKYIKKMVETGRIERRGSKKTGGYYTL